MIKFYGVYDKVSGVYVMPLINEANDATAIRAFRNSCANENSLLFTNGTDFQLFKLFEINQENGEVKNDIKWLANGGTENGI